MGTWSARRGGARATLLAPVPTRLPAEPSPAVRRGLPEPAPWDGADTTRESIALAADRESSTQHLDVRDLVRLARALPGLTLEEEIGRGASGAVWRGRWVLPSGIERRVAVKELRGGADGEERVRRLRDEGRLLGRLNHRSIARVEEVLDVEGWPVVLVEYVEGADLDVLLGRGELPARAAAELLAEVAAALEAAHAGVDDGAGQVVALVHGELTPVDVRVTRWGEVKVIGFGAARDEHVDPAADVYALGALAWACATGEYLGPLPLQAGAHRDLVFRALERVADPDWRALVRAMLEFDPSDRPDAGAARRILESIARHAGGPSLRDWAARALGPEAVEEAWADEVTGTIGAVDAEEEEEGGDAERTVTQVGLVTEEEEAGRPAAVPVDEGGPELSLRLDAEPELSLRLDPDVLPASVGPVSDAEAPVRPVEPAPELSLALDPEVSLRLDNEPSLSLRLDDEPSLSLRLDAEAPTEKPVAAASRLDADPHPAASAGDPDPEPSLSLRLDVELEAERATASPIGGSRPVTVTRVTPPAAATAGEARSLEQRVPRLPPARPDAPRSDGAKPGAPVIKPVLRPPPVLPPTPPPAPTPPPPVAEEPEASGLDALPQWVMVIGGAAIGVLGGLAIVALLLAVLVLRARSG